MKKFFTKVWEAIKRGFMMFIVSTWYVWVAVIVGLLIGWIFGGMVGVFTFFGLVLSVILYVFGRQIYWWFAGKVDYQDGGFPKLWRKIFKK